MHVLHVWKPSDISFCFQSCNIGIIILTLEMKNYRSEGTKLVHVHTFSEVRLLGFEFSHHPPTSHCWLCDSGQVPSPILCLCFFFVNWGEC